MNIAVLTGKRGGSGALTPTVRELRERGHDVWWLATDQHVSQKFGSTLKELNGDIRCVGWPQHGDRPEDRLFAMADGLHDLRHVFLRDHPDCIVLFGDRGETLMTAIAAHQLNIPVVHIQGGDASGCLDDDMRHAISHLAKLHLPSNAESADRLRRMGVKGDIRVVGDLHLDMMDERTPFGDLRDRYNVGWKAYDIVLVHPDTEEPENSEDLIIEALETATGVDCKIAVYPCSDQGHQAIIDHLRTWERPLRRQVFKNIPQRDFHGLLQGANALIGNSSAGVIEAPYLKTRFIEIGNRQRGRYRGDYGDGKAYLKVADAIEGLLAKRNPVQRGEPAEVAAVWAY